MNKVLVYAAAVVIVVGPVLVLGYLGERTYPGYGYLFSTFASLSIGAISTLLR